MSAVPAPRAGLDLSAGLIARARSDAAARGISITDSLEESSGLSPSEFLHAIGESLAYPVAHMDELRNWQFAHDVLPFDEASRSRCAALRDQGGRLHLVTGDPFNSAQLAWGEERVRAVFTWTLAHRADLAAFFAREEANRSAMEGVVAARAEDDAGGNDMLDLSLQSIAADQSPVIRIVNSTLYDAHKAGASDIHLETGVGGLNIKYRIDGVLSQIAQMPGTPLAEQVISRVKVMSELDIAESRVPQDGRFKISIRGREIDFRVSIMPSVFGEDAVLRILDKQALTDQVKGLDLGHLGFDAGSIEAIRRLSSEPYGMLLVTGPTGSGKTTTLYAAISEINTGRDKIITIEDPVEYQLPGVLQIPVNEKKGLGFARGLRSILRHDPDRVMVGEIRDAETAQIAIQAALTGHLVFTTVHANNVFDVLGRFTHMAVDPHSFVAALNGIVAQRLVRLNCPQCRIEATPDAALLRASGLLDTAIGEFHFRSGRGCGHCRGTGYKGRKAIAEILVLDDELRELIVARAPIRTLKEAARRNGVRFLREQALELVRAGDTDLPEINRVTFASGK